MRAELGMDLRLGQDLAGIFYQMVTRADARLLLTRPYLAKDGESWEPSPFWLAVQEVIGKQTMRVRPEDHRPLSEASSPEELVFWAARRSAVTGSPLEESLAGPYQERCQSLNHAQRVLAERVNGLDGAAHQGDLSALADALRERFGSNAVWSASRLESYATCPFSFLVSAALGLELIRPPKAGFESYQLGSLLHEVLEQVYRECSQPENVEAVLALLPEVAARVFEDAPRKYAFRPTLLWEVQKAELLETLRAAVIGLAELDAEAGWQPAEFECRFGIEGAPFLEIMVDGQPVRLRGLIDRIDRDRHGKLRVIDYKSGGSHLAAQDLIEGRRLQLPLYALAVEQALGIGKVTEGLYWKLFAQESGSLRLSRFACDLGSGPDAAYDLAIQHIERLVSDIRSGAFSPQPPEGGCPSYCHASSWCWSYRPRPVY
jgi:ATP-dependent helicase/DNAse subunit B